MTVPRTYRSELREQQAERTREQIAAAARACFLGTGWSGTTVRAVARAAGVSEATVYNAYGSKAGLAASLIDAAERSADIAGAVEELAGHVGDPLRQLGTFVGFDRRLFEHGGDVLRLAREARRQHADLAAAYEQGRARGDAARRTTFASWDSSALRDGVDVEQAVTVYAVVVSLESYDVALEHGWSPDDVQAWWHSTLAHLLLA